MQHRFLLLCGRFLHGIRHGFHVLALLPLMIAAQSWLLWPIAILLIPWSIFFSVLSTLFQIPASMFGFALQNRINVCATLDDEGIHFKTESSPASRLISWEDIAFIHRVYERTFPLYEVRFQMAAAYRIRLQSGEIIFVDSINENALHWQAMERDIPFDGFDSRICATQFESKTSIETQSSPPQIGAGNSTGRTSSSV